VVEFALVFPAFLAMIFGVFEVGLLFFKQQLLDNALQTASRSVLVRIVSQENLSPGNAAQMEEDFRNEVCQESFFYSSTSACADVKLQFLVGRPEINANRSVAPFIDGSTNPPTINVPNTQKFNLPAAGDRVVIRAYAPTSTIIARLNGIGISFANGASVLVSSTAFVVEPDDE
jgi:Flp pilus assembly protein TadG